MQHEDILSVIGVIATAGIMAPTGTFDDPLNNPYGWFTLAGWFKVIGVIYIMLLITKEFPRIFNFIKRVFKSLSNIIMVIWHWGRKLINRKGDP